MSEGHVQRIHTGSVVLDIGDDAGALLIYVPPAMLGEEVEILHTQPGAAKIHTDVVEWVVNGRTSFAAVFPPLPVGRYEVCQPHSHRGEGFTLEPARVTEVDWREKPTAEPGR